jgi:hypothetical protein
MCTAAALGSFGQEIRLSWVHRRSAPVRPRRNFAHHSAGRRPPRGRLAHHPAIWPCGEPNKNASPPNKPFGWMPAGWPGQLRRAGGALVYWVFAFTEVPTTSFASADIRNATSADTRFTALNPVTAQRNDPHPTPCVHVASWGSAT